MSADKPLDCIMIYRGHRYPLDLNSPNLLAAISAAGLEFSELSGGGACGGAGICGGCALWVKDDSGVKRVLACKTPPQAGMLIMPERLDELRIEEAGQPPIGPSSAAAPKTTAVADEAIAASCANAAMGMAIDLGSTSIVARLCDLKSGRLLASAARPNPQIAFGSDVISRISACSQGALPRMQEGTISALSSMIDEACRKAKRSRSAVQRCVLVGNSVMEHIAAGISPEGLGAAPFKLGSRFGSSVDLPQLAPDVYFAPLLDAYVGGDIVADILNCGFVDSDGTKLLLDLGTNAEIVLLHKGTMSCCATAAGPVFEAAGISYGMPALPGAIDELSYSLACGNGSFDLHVIGNASPMGLCGSGVLAAMDALLSAEIIRPDGLMLGGNIDSCSNIRRFELAPGIFIDQKDVRKFQLAKSAIASGMQCLLEAADLQISQIEELFIAGGFGQHIDPACAKRVGLIPRIERCRSIGNAAIEGATQLLLNEDARQQAAQLAKTMRYLELSGNSSFDSRYLQNLNLQPLA